jgi:tRNA nucleotidyltransferase (CCA-adding enzyme)
MRLSPQEEKIFETLRKVNAKFRLGITFRVAGGWVRDKLLGTESDDIDVALDRMTGKQLEHYLLRYGQSHPEAEIGKSYTVKADVEQSKHLETTSVEISGKKIDFVNLRSEEYGQTRIPSMRMGTPQTDAERRDLTINALFFNVNAGQVEDYVGGLGDLGTMTLRTPLDPTKTFSDDPLRMLRVLRFYSRYPKAKIAPELVKSMSDPEVQAAYRDKVSSERSGPELMKLLAGAKPAEALRIMFDTGLDKSVFHVPETESLKDLRMDQQNKYHAHNLLDHTLLVVKNMEEILREENAPDDIRVKMLMAALFHDYGKAHPEIQTAKEDDPTQRQYIGHEEKSAEIADSIMRSISIPEADRKFVDKVIALHMRPHRKGQEWTPRSIGRFMRETDIPGQESGDVWRWVMLLGVADTLGKDASSPDFADAEKKREMIQRMRDFKTRPGPSIAKPLLDGHELMAMFPTLRPDAKVEGKTFIKDISARLLDEQSAGNIQTKEQAVDFVRGIEKEIADTYGRPKGGSGPTSSWIASNTKLSRRP